jgi:hypothetical protein
MQAYEVPNGKKVVIVDDTVYYAPVSRMVSKDDILTIVNLDGMYSNCLDSNGDRVYIAAYTDVKIIE